MTDNTIDPDAGAFLAAADAMFERLPNRTQPAARSFSLPGYSLAVEFAGAELADALCMAFVHRENLPQPVDTATLTWRIGDLSLVSDAELPPPRSALHPFGNLYRSKANDILVERRQGVASVYDKDRNRVTTLADGLPSLDTDLAAKPLLRFLLALMLQKELVLCHAAMLGSPAGSADPRGMLVTGFGGAGKSTIAAAGLLGGAGFGGDDFVVLEKRGDALIGHGLYATLMLDGEHMQNFPSLRDRVVRFRKDTFAKYLLPIVDHFPRSMQLEMEIEAVAMPEIVDRADSSLEPASMAAILHAMTASTLMATPWRENRRMQFILDHVGSLEPLVYRSGRDFLRTCEPLKERYNFD